jgi:ubiquinone biosynthesis protein
MHFEAGYVPPHQDEAAFAQALRAVGEPVFGLKAHDVSMGRLLAQLFEITAIFDMRLRPELVLLQKTMVTVEGVARRIDPANDIWAAAEPVVARWIARELSPAARIRDLAREARGALATLARLSEPAAVGHPVAPADPSQVVSTETRGGLPAAVWFLAGAASSALGFGLAAVLRLGAVR